MRDTGLDDPVGRDDAQRDALHGHLASSRGQEAGDDAQERGLAGPVRPDDRDRLAGLDPHRHAEQGLEGAVTGIDVAQA